MYAPGRTLPRAGWGGTSTREPSEGEGRGRALRPPLTDSPGEPVQDGLEPLRQVRGVVPHVGTGSLPRTRCFPRAFFGKQGAPPRKKPVRATLGIASAAVGSLGELQESYPRANNAAGDIRSRIEAQRLVVQPRAIFEVLARERRFAPRRLWSVAGSGRSRVPLDPGAPWRPPPPAPRRLRGGAAGGTGTAVSPLPGSASPALPPTTRTVAPRLVCSSSFRLIAPAGPNRAATGAD